MNSEENNNAAPSNDWQPPSSDQVGWKGRSAEELRDLAFRDQEKNDSPPDEP